MPAKFSLEQIREHWKQQALEHGQAPSASWSDRMVIEMEVREILKHLAKGDRILDVGCANGYSTVQYASQLEVDIRGIDNIPEMVAQARRRLADFHGRLPGTVEFVEGDVLAIPGPSDTYDKVIAVRVMINLGTWARQQAALLECARVLKPGGLLVLSEASLQGWQRLNNFRKEWQLADIPMPPFNQYLDENLLVEAVAPHLELLELVNFASTYYVGTRVIKPLLSRALGGIVDAANPDLEWNRWFSMLPPSGDYGTQKLFLFRKS
jgi:ubiquinone/menaquinone biosynthesis C-methylase UbiE